MLYHLGPVYRLCKRTHTDRFAICLINIKGPRMPLYFKMPYVFRVRNLTYKESYKPEHD